MLFEKIREAAAYLQSQISHPPRLGLVLGSGFDSLVEDVEVEVVVPYLQIPHFPVSTAPGHRGELVFGRFEGQPAALMVGRVHYYEGYSMQEVTFPVRVLRALGVETLFLTAAAGSLQGHIRPGDLVILRDHINLFPENPLRGANDERLGPRFPDMLDAYDRGLIDKALAIAHGSGIPAHRGVYVAFQGPNLETPAEYGFLHRLGADVVGMSTVPEAIVARHAGMKVFGLAVVTDACYPLNLLEPTTAESVLKAARRAMPAVRQLFSVLISLE